MRTIQALVTVLTAGVLGDVCETQAQVVIETVVVGNPGNRFLIAVAATDPYALYDEDMRALGPADCD